MSRNKEGAQMKAFYVSTIGSRSLAMALLLGIFLSGCGREQAQSPFPPTVIAVSPLNGAVNVALNSAVTATFSSVMAPATINTTTFTVTGPGGLAVAGAVTLVGATATFTPSGTLAANTLYIATVTTGAKDPGGNALAANFVWTFTTSAPAVISTVPANGATAVAVNTTVTATFNEVMNAATINAASFTLQGPGVTPVAGTVTYTGTTATFTPTLLLAANTLYTATITTGAQDPTGAALAANFVWTFTTDIAPTVVSTVPANLATAVAVNATVNATFSRAMNPATINGTTFLLQGPGVTPVAGAVTYSGSTATFTPTALLAANTVYTATITIGAKDPTGNALAANFAWTFTTNVAPTVVSTVPANGATMVAVNATINATFSRAMNPATISGTTFLLQGPGATAVAGAVTYTGNTATFTPTALLAANTVYTATITTGAQDPTGSALAANFAWTFTTNPAPTVLSTVPANGDVAVAVNATINATFSRAMDPTTINGTTFTLTGPGATAVAGTVTFAGTTATFTPTAVLAANTLYTATITTGAKDPTGSALAANFVWTFTTDVAPTVVSTTPTNGASGVPVNTTVTATFSRPMDATTITAATFTLMGPGGVAIAGGVTYAGVTATFTPGANLAANTLYTATITTGAKDPTGNALAANFVWTFMTTPPPAVTSTNPANGATNVPVNQKVTATFNQSMNAATITAAGTFVVTVTTGGAAVPGTVTYDDASHSAIFTPTAALAINTQFTATITTAAQSAGGGALASNYVWSFTTGAATDATAPTVTSTNPANLATLVPLNQKISATFSEAMDPATISAPGTFTLVTTVGAIAVPGALAYDTASNNLVFTPTANLAPSTQYTATISNAATDLAGNALIAGAAANPWTFTTGTLLNNAGPTITVTNPASGAMNVPIDQSISATFSAPMDPTTINNQSFTVAIAGGGAAVSGTVAYDSASQIATFTPSANLATSTQYTATISNTVTDLSGNALVAGGAPNPWNFTTGLTAGAGQAKVNLGSASSFAVMATSSISSTGPVIINGDVGLHPGTSQGIPPNQVNGTIHVNDAAIIQAQADLLAAYNDAVSRSTNSQTLPGNMAGLTFTPGLYTNSTSVLIMGAPGPTNNVTLDAQGDPNAVFIFKMGSTLTTAPNSHVILAGGAKAANVFWQVGTSATIDTTSIFKGNVLAAVSITLDTGATVEGRMLAGSSGGAASVTVNASSVTVPAP